MDTSPAAAERPTDGLDLIDPAAYAAAGPPHASFTALRRHSPLHRCHPAGYAPFWAVTKHATIAENPDQLAALRRRPELVESTVEEVVRWATPVNYMRRTAARDVELCGRQIRKGDHLVLFYASANRDEDVYDDPFRFRVDRDPNPHLGFGIGEHFCLGAHLARRSQRTLFAELARRLETVELAGEPEWIRSSFVVGLKHLPIRYRLRADA
jgi:cytochrome P450